MKPWMKGIAVVLIQLFLVLSLGGKMLYDRSVRPRVWVRTAPYDPSLPIRGRYVRLQIVVSPKGLSKRVMTNRWTRSKAVRLVVENKTLIAEADPIKKRYNHSDLHVRKIVTRNKEELFALDKRVAFFIPEHVKDPSRLKEGEQLWVEVTVPKNGPPRPVRLGIKKGDGPIQPLTLN